MGEVKSFDLNCIICGSEVTIYITHVVIIRILDMIYLFSLKCSCKVTVVLSGFFLFSKLASKV